MRKAALAVGGCFLIWCAYSITQSVFVSDERCDFCGETMQFDHATPGLNATLAIYRCHNCDQRGQREFRDDGTINWTEW